LILKALRPELEVTLTEARRKKVSFLKQAAREMDLNAGLDIRHQRVGWDTRRAEYWPEVVSRAAFPPAEWIRHGSQLVAPGGRLWIFSGQPQGEDELGDPAEDLKAVMPDGFRLGPAHAYRLPFCGRQRRLVSVRRVDDF
jgi:16S rRNA G527 N7-methylase RsmG